ncbi:MBL fold metallo-hydrolase [Mucilaginibacter psychrotolerans]|uniref:MBL fold metallo-hydrolase n=1 Tax=Mucilaginibacter psychrotolerans TaxID=1524096 RepID=A0A4Y8SL54_9SPHI|nr:MBL fold metallo-hydrolase [Mucilaginibacter psychrotolerans]TFF39174.1 MBL fold metallo-hydrolase [Mucilaginibacter psychrotolerans]
MPVFIASLNSGSNGNCYYVGNEREAVLIDAGISCRETERRMARLGLSLQKVKAIFISHEHSDHIRGLGVLARKYNIPVYATHSTAGYCGDLPPGLCIGLNAYTPVSIGSLQVSAFPKHHDAVDPHSFLVTDGDIRIGVFTDIGAPCEHLIKHFNQCHAAFLEANYDEAMLEGGRYPYHLKKRIRGGKGHLSNRQALQLFIDHKPHYMSHLLLAHLSKDNNDPELALQLFVQHAGNTHVSVASRYNESEVFTIYPAGAPIAQQVALNQITGQFQFAL